MAKDLRILIFLWSHATRTCYTGQQFDKLPVPGGKCMKTYLTVAAITVAVVVGFCGGLLVQSSSVHAQSTQRKPKEPVASTDEFRSHVIHYPDLPPVELVKGSNSRLVTGEQSMISFLK